MSTNDVPGNNKNNNDQLSCGCWAEHDDESLIFVESTENDQVVFSVFDLSKTPPVEYRDSMPIKDFKKAFSVGGKSGEKWTWHDKSAFPFDKIMKDIPSGPRVASGNAALTAAERIADTMKLHRQGIINKTKYSHLVVQTRSTVSTLKDKIQRAIAELRV